MSWCASDSCLQPSTGSAGTTFAAALQFFAMQQCLIPQEWPGDHIQDGDSFDFVVVGAGSAGFTLAARLAEVPRWRVLLVEAGGAPPVESIIPSFGYSLIGTKYDWHLQTENDGFSAQSLQDGIDTIVKGKMLGGSSSINGMIYARGNPADYNEWASSSLGWDWESVLPYFKKAENMKDDLVLNSLDTAILHGTKGPLLVSRREDFGEINNNLIEAFEEIGLPKLLDINSLYQLGMGPPHYTAFNGIRQSTAQIFSNRALNQSNFYVLKNALATKLLYNNEKTRTIGVEILINNENYINIFAELEVISSGGVFGSPQLLLLSGIGPKQDLDELGIPVVVDLPVGENLSDHIVVNFYLTGLNRTQNVSDVYFQSIEYLYNRTGILSYNTYEFLTGYFGNVETQYGIRPEYQVSSIQLPASNANVSNCSESSFNFRVDDGVCQSLLAANKDHELYQFVVFLTLRVAEPI